MFGAVIVIFLGFFSIVLEWLTVLSENGKSFEAVRIVVWGWKVGFLVGNGFCLDFIETTEQLRVSFRRTVFLVLLSMTF